MSHIKLVVRDDQVNAHFMTVGGRTGEDPRFAQERAWARWALQQWETFPVDRGPRPLVLTAPPVGFERGFRSGNGKMAFLHGDIESAVRLPDGLREVLRESEHDETAVPGRRRWKSPLLITQAHPCQAEFATDRGMREFAAWQLGGPDIDGACWVLDPTIASQRWTPPRPKPDTPFGGQAHRAASATIEDDGLVLHFTFTGAPPEYVEYPSTEVVETDQALVVLPVERDVGPPGFRIAVGCARTVVAKLAYPLGGRVVIELDASPVMVVAHNPT